MAAIDGPTPPRPATPFATPPGRRRIGAAVQRASPLGGAGRTPFTRRRDGVVRRRERALAAGDARSPAAPITRRPPGAVTTRGAASRIRRSLRRGRRDRWRRRRVVIFTGGRA